MKRLWKREVELESTDVHGDSKGEVMIRAKTDQSLANAPMRKYYVLMANPYLSS